MNKQHDLFLYSYSRRICSNSSTLALLSNTVSSRACKPAEMDPKNLTTLISQLCAAIDQREANLAGCRSQVAA